MHTRLALATGATVKARYLYPILADKHRGPGPGLAYTDLAYYGVWGPTTILKGGVRGGGRGARTRETPNIDSFEISNSSLSCRGAAVMHGARGTRGTDDPGYNRAP